MATRKPAKPKTAAELKQQLEDAKKRIAALEQRAYAEELAELIKSTNIIADFNNICARVTDVKPVTILAAVGAAVGIKRLEIKQSPAPTRKPADPNVPKKPRKKASPK